jgi:SAM domain (Sterile alpha motif)
MQQIADWLDKLGMSEYAERFAENRIDLSVLPDLTDQDLEKLGVVLGDRRKMLRAIAELNGVEKGASKPAPPAAAPVAPQDAADNGSCYRSKMFRAACKRLGLRHTLRGPTERPNASFRRHCANGPTLAPTTTRISDRPSCCTGYIATIGIGHMVA